MTKTGRQSPVHVFVPAWDPNTFLPDCVAMIVGPRGHGKTVFFEDLMSYNCEKFFAAMAMSPTRDSRLMFEKHMPFSLVYHDYQPDRITDFMTTMREHCEWLGIEARNKGLDPENDRERRIVALFLDDCLADAHALRARPVSDIFMNGRHEDTCFISMMQYMFDMPKRLRAMLTYVMFTATDHLETIEAVYKMFFKTQFPTLDSFSKFFNTVTADNHVLIIDRSRCKRDTKNGSYEGSGNLFVYKARYPPPKYSLCSPSIWFLHYAKMINRAKVEKRQLQVRLQKANNFYRKATRRQQGPGTARIATEIRTQQQHQQQQQPRVVDHDSTRTDQVPTQQQEVCGTGGMVDIQQFAKMFAPKQRMSVPSKLVVHVRK